MAIPRLRPGKLSGSFYGSSSALSRRGQRVGKQLSDALVDIFDQFEDASADIMLESMEPTFEKSQRYVPVRTGELKRSGYLEDISTPKHPMVQIGYGKGGSPDHAIYVHEAVHIPHAAPTRSKYLQAAVMEDLDSIFQLLGVNYKRFMGS